jgi:cation transport ATPase
VASGLEACSADGQFCIAAVSLDQASSHVMAAALIARAHERNLRLVRKIPLLIDSDQCRGGEYPQTASCNQTHEGISKC